jgi:hypothetical protein
VVSNLDGFLMRAIGVICRRVRDLRFISKHYLFLARLWGRNPSGCKIVWAPGNLGDYERISERDLMLRVKRDENNCLHSVLSDEGIKSEEEEERRRRCVVGDPLYHILPQASFQETSLFGHAWGSKQTSRLPVAASLGIRSSTSVTSYTGSELG